ncbi:MAG: carbamate kinase [Ignavibacteria bacterium]|nr:carbamate kinase [Ignavibacteria bacterium]
MKKIAVVAFGGNAILRGDQKGTIEEQEKNTYDTCMNIIPLLERGYELVITHGNGPVVGNILQRNEAANQLFGIPIMPLDICVADSEGGIGYMIEMQMMNALNEKGIKKQIATLITQVEVDKNDEAFKDPTKPIGKFYSKGDAERFQKESGWIMKEDARKRGFRRVVPSPQPRTVIKRDLIKSLVETGSIVIACGGGGIPVYRHDNGHLEAIEAVIDKDLASSLLAIEIGADAFYILTDISKVALNFCKPDQKLLDELSVSDAKKYLAEGQFPSGSMGPKIQAAVEFVEATGKEMIITESRELSNPKSGTRIVK